MTKIIEQIGQCKTSNWSPWLGCFRVSEGCAKCFISKVDTFEDNYLPLNPLKAKANEFIVISMFTDLFLENADHLRGSVWQTIKAHPEIIFEIITKRVERIEMCLPEDWGDGYENVIFCVSVENQRRVDERIPILQKLPCKHRWLNCAPLLEDIDITKYLKAGTIEAVNASGERWGQNVRGAKYAWMKHLSEQCRINNVHFEIMNLGQDFDNNGQIIHDFNKCYRSELAKSLDLDNYIPLIFNI